MTWQPRLAAPWRFRDDAIPRRGILGKPGDSDPIEAWTKFACREGLSPRTVPGVRLVGRHEPRLPLSVMRSSGTSAVVCAALVAAVCGCRLVNRGPVAPELADARRLCNEGLSAADRDDLDRAENLFEQAVKHCPADVDARRHYADVLWRRGERQQAVGQLVAALEMSPADPALCVEAGRMHLELGLLDDAERLAAEAVRLAPRSADSWRLHGRVALARGRFEIAVADFHRALAIAGDDRELLADTARAYMALDRPRRALSTLAIIAEDAGPDGLPADLLAVEARAQEALGRPAEAAAAWRRAIAKGDAPPEAVERLAALEAAAGQIRR